MAVMAIYEVTLLYPDRSYDEHRRFLAAVAGGRSSGLASFGRHGAGVALTFEIETDLGPATATRIARQRAIGFWPSFRPSVTLEAVEAPPQAS